MLFLAFEGRFEEEAKPTEREKPQEEAFDFGVQVQQVFEQSEPGRWGGTGGGRQKVSSSALPGNRNYFSVQVRLKLMDLELSDSWPLGRNWGGP